MDGTPQIISSTCGMSARLWALSLFCLSCFFSQSVYPLILSSLRSTERGLLFVARFSQPVQSRVASGSAFQLLRKAQLEVPGLGPQPFWGLHLFSAEEDRGLCA